MSITILNTAPTPDERAISLHIADTSGLIFGTLAILATCFGLSLPLNKLLSEHSTDTTFSISLALVFWTLTGFAIVQHIIQTRKTGDTHPFRLHILTPKRWQLLGGALTTSEETGALSQIFRAAFPSPEQQNSPARTPQDLATYFPTARETRVMTQAHLAQAAGITTRTIQRLETTGKASQETIRALCSVLEVPLPPADSLKASQPVSLIWSVYRFIETPIILITAFFTGTLLLLSGPAIRKNRTARRIVIGLIATDIVVTISTAIGLQLLAGHHLDLGIPDSETFISRTLMISLATQILLLPLAGRILATQQARFSLVVIGGCLFLAFIPVSRLIYATGELAEFSEIQKTSQFSALSSIKTLQAIGNTDLSPSQSLCLHMVIEPTMLGTMSIPTDAQQALLKSTNPDQFSTIYRGILEQRITNLDAYIKSHPTSQTLSNILAFQKQSLEKDTSVCTGMIFSANKHTTQKMPTDQSI